MKLWKTKIWPTVDQIWFRRGTRGWGCRISYRVDTRRQFTMESHVVEGFSPSGWRGPIGLIWAFCVACKEAVLVRRYLQKEPGDYDIVA